MERKILHSDLNNFYASVECLYNPCIRDRPVAVAGNAEKRRGIILAKNNIAKKFGVKTADTLWEAQRKCPDIIFVSPSYDKYLRYSKMAKEIYCEYTDKIESFGLDECWLDVTGSVSLFGNGKEIADKIRKRIKYELGVTVSIGVSFNKVFAKLGSDMKKPDATTVITKENYRDKVWPLPVGDLLGVGSSTKNKLKKYGIDTICSLAKAPPELLKRELGINGIMLWQFANGLENSPVAFADSHPDVKSIGNSTTLPYDVSDPEDVKITMYVLSESVASRLRESNLQCKTVQIGLRDKNLCSFERQGKLGFPTNSSEEIFKKAFLLYSVNKPAVPLRSISIRSCGLIGANERQLSCLNEFIAMEKNEKLEKSIDIIRNRFGHSSIQRAVMLTNPRISNINPKTDHIIHPVGFIK